MDKTITRAMSEGAVWLSSGAVLLKLIALINILYILRNLSVYEYGLVELVLSIVPLFGPFLVPGLSGAVLADIGVERGKGNMPGAKLIIDNFFKLQFVLCIVAWAIVFFGANVIAQFYPEHISQFFRIVSFTFLIAPFRSIFALFFSVNLKFFQQSVFSLVEEFSKFVFMVIFFSIFASNSLGLLLAIVCSQVVAVLIMSPSFWKLYRMLPEPTEQKPFWSLFYDHGKWSIFSSYLGTLGQNAQLWIIKFMLGTEAVGLFAVAQGFIGHLMSLMPLTKILSSLMPQYIGDERRFFRLMSSGIKYQLLGSIVVATVAFFVGPIFISLVVPKYLLSMDLFKILLLSLPIVSLVSVFNNVFFVFKKQKDFFFANAIYKTGATVLFVPLLIHFFGINGAAYTGVLVALLFLIERYRVVRKILPQFRIVWRELYRFDEYDSVILNHLFLMFRIRRN
jgi:O-antigen/teichoic acid export membrane protein